MALIGKDFSAARRGWLYDASAAQPLLTAAGLALALLVLHMILQLVAAGVLTAVLSGGHMPPKGSAELAKLSTRAAVLALLPEGILISLIAYGFARIGSRNATSVLSLRFPNLGWGGWLAIVVGFVVAVALWNVGIMKALGIDSSTYLPTSDGVTDSSSSSGLVEKTIADMADEPLMFWSAFPAVMFAAPLAEEFIFRGAIFSALMRKGFGKAATVVVTSALWALLHAMAAPWMFVLLIFGMGIMLGLLLLRFGSLWVTIVCHCVWNSLTMLAISSVVQG